MKAEIFKNKCSNTSNSKYNPKSSTPQILINNCILKENQTRTTIPVQITTNETTCTLSIDPETVKYPDKWVKRSHLINNNKSEISETEQRAKQIFDKIGERPTLMFQSKEMVLTNKVGLAIDEKLADKTQKYLDKQNIKHEQFPKSQSKLETKKGMTVFVIDESTITPETKNIFIERAGGTIKNNEEYKAALNSIPNRSKILSLEDIPTLITLAKPSQDAELPQNTNIPEAPKNENKVVEENKPNTSIPQQDAAVKNQAASSTAISLPSSPITIGSNSKDGLGAALAPDTVKAKENGTVENDYSIRFNQNIYPDAKQACLHQKQLQPQTSTLQIMTEVIQAKLEQHPRLTKEITIRGGVEWLNSCEAIGNSNNTGWDGIGNQSALINAIAQAYTNVIEEQNNLQKPDIPAFSPPDSLPQSTPQSTPKSIPEPTLQTQAKSQSTPQSIPKSIPQIKTENQTIKVISGGQTGADMGGLIGAKALGLPTSGIAAAGWMTENGANPKLQDYGLIEGEKGASIKETYAKRTIANIKESDGTIILGDINSTGSKLTLDIAKEQNKPTLAIPLETVLSDKLAAAKQENFQQPQSDNNLTGSDSFPIPNPRFPTPPSINNESDTEQQVYERNEQLENALNSTNDGKQKIGVMDPIIEKMKANTIQTLQDWYVASQQLGKSERYLNRIQEVTEDYIKDNISLHKAFASMDNDIKTLSKVNEITALAQKITNTFGSMDVNGITSVQTESYKNYKIATKVQDKTYLIKDKDDNVLLYVKQGKTQVNNLNDDVIRDFRFMQYKIDNSLQNARKELVER